MEIQIERYEASRGYDRQTCWTQARAGVIPASSPDQSSTAVVTMQKLRLLGSDDYEPLHNLYSTDGGQTWTPPVEQAAFLREEIGNHEGGPIERTVCDFSPKWHAASGKLLGTGHTVYYHGGRLLSNRPRETPYSVYDPATHTWSNWRTLQMPDGIRFFNSGAGCTQRFDLENGEILLPIYFKSGEPYSLSSTVVRCAFDGETLRYLEHGSELTVPVPRGLGEPSIIRFEGRFFLTLRNDEKGFVATSEDGLHYDEPRPWLFNDGQELGSYNTQQHWLLLGGKLFLVYTRRGLNNDHVFRHRAPMMMAQVDPQKLCVLRDTELMVIPERGARLGNFGVTQVSENEAWVVETEWMQNSGGFAQAMLQKLRERLPEEEVQQLAATPHFCGACEQFGSDNTVWFVKVTC